MAYIFDSLGYAKRLRDGGVPRDQAEAHAEAARDFIMVELATKADLLPIKADLQVVKADLLAMKQELQAEFRGRATELRGTITELEGKLQGSITELRGSVVELRNSIDTQGLRLTVRLGAMIVVGIGALAAILKLA
jgi:multidrug efflux pump subunit AcrA (membrane-fusion protein)